MSKGGETGEIVSLKSKVVTEEVGCVGLTEIGMGSVVVVTDFLFLLGEVGSGESSLLGETLGERTLEERVEGLSGVERGGWAVVAERRRGDQEGGERKVVEGHRAQWGDHEGGESRVNAEGS